MWLGRRSRRRAGSTSAARGRDAGSGRGSRRLFQTPPYLLHPWSRTSSIPGVGWLWIAAAVLALDQASKWLALERLTLHESVPLLPFLNLTLVYNKGAAFGFLSTASGWQNLFFIAIAIIATAVILYLLRRMGTKDRFLAAALMLILGGAVGNLIDRLLYGHVVDFVDVYYDTWHWPAFNIADSAITVGAVMILLDAIGIGRRKTAS